MPQSTTNMPTTFLRPLRVYLLHKCLKIIFKNLNSYEIVQYTESLSPMKLVNINKITNNAFQKKKNQFNKTAHLALIICYCVFLLVKKKFIIRYYQSKYTLCKTFNLKDLINVKKNDIIFFYMFVLITVLKVYLFFYFL